LIDRSFAIAFASHYQPCVPPSSYPWMFMKRDMIYSFLLTIIRSKNLFRANQERSSNWKSSSFQVWKRENVTLFPAWGRRQWTASYHWALRGFLCSIHRSGEWPIRFWHLWSFYKLLKLFTACLSAYPNAQSQDEDAGSSGGFELIPGSGSSCSSPVPPPCEGPDGQKSE
jgi:hypothetical protein